MTDNTKPIFFLAGILSLFLTGCTFFPDGGQVTTHFSLECEPCSKDLKNVEQCQAFLERMSQNDPAINQTATALGIDATKVTYMQKELNYNSGKVTCKYFNRKPAASAR